MPSQLGTEAAVAGVRVLPAPVIDFQFALFSLAKSCNDPDKQVPQWVNELQESHGELIRRIADFWPARGLGEFEGAPYFEWGELLVAAWRADRLFTPQVTDFLDGLERSLSSTETTPPLYSEPRAIEDLVDRRLRHLRDDPEDRSRYIELMREFWGVLKPYWENAGSTDAARTAGELSNRLRNDVDLRSLVPGNNFLHKDEYRSQIANAQARGELFVVPLGLAGHGQLYWALPGVVLIGAGLESAEREARRRERAERAAGRLKVLSDPTRLAILIELLRPSHHAGTVTELASLFELSQPTVSVHIKMLREAGLARAERDGNQVHYQADEATIRAYLAGATDDIVGASHRTAARAV
jgi:ArsR family transcriptional regulator